MNTYSTKANAARAARNQALADNPNIGKYYAARFVAENVDITRVAGGWTWALKTPVTTVTEPVAVEPVAETVEPVAEEAPVTTVAEPVAEEAEPVAEAVAIAGPIATISRGDFRITGVFPSLAEANHARTIGKVSRRNSLVSMEWIRGYPIKAAKFIRANGGSANTDMSKDELVELALQAFQKFQAKLEARAQADLVTDEPVTDEPVAEEAQKVQAQSAGAVKTAIRLRGTCHAVWTVADSMVGSPRKDVVAACVAQGIPLGTAKTQFQKWFRHQATK